MTRCTDKCCRGKQPAPARAEPPSWLAIALAWAAGLAVIVMTWSF